jgi:hypothetical protein
MTKKQLIKKVNDCLKSDKKLIQDKIQKAINSGCMDIEGAEDNYVLPKYLISAIYREMSRQYTPPYGGRKAQKEINNIYAHL